MSRQRVDWLGPRQHQAEETAETNTRGRLEDAKRSLQTLEARQLMFMKYRLRSEQSRWMAVRWCGRIEKERSDVTFQGPCLQPLVAEWFQSHTVK